MPPPFKTRVQILKQNEMLENHQTVLRFHYTHLWGEKGSLLERESGVVNARIQQNLAECMGGVWLLTLLSSFVYVGKF